VAAAVVEQVSLALGDELLGDGRVVHHRGLLDWGDHVPRSG
jgi:hypothetical protein